MKLEQQVVSLELAKKLKELGVKQESLFWWYRRGHYFFQTEEIQPSESELTDEKPPYSFPYEVVASAFTVAELGEMLPQRAEIETFKSYVFGTKELRWRVVLTFKDGEEIEMPMDLSDTEADARAKMLIHLIENNLINQKIVEERGDNI